ncbi:unnamed protein product [Amoebophrya sp. A25]|nr:unnamed protein product [Amoebophrya sp. A25]|eukprot:GSA25T00025876001.1
MKRSHLRVLCLFWFCVNLLYYGLSFSVEQLVTISPAGEDAASSRSSIEEQGPRKLPSSRPTPGQRGDVADIYILSALLGSVEFPAIYLVAKSMNSVRFGRRLSSVLFWLVAGLACLASSAFLTNEDLLVVPSASRALVLMKHRQLGKNTELAGTITAEDQGGHSSSSGSAEETFTLYSLWGCLLIGKMCMTAQFALLYVWGSEVFHTSHRSTAMAWQSASARVSGVCLHPLLSLLDLSGTMVLFAAAGLVCSMLCALRVLPETRGKALDETLVEHDKEMSPLKVVHRTRNKSKPLEQEPE